MTKKYSEFPTGIETMTSRISTELQVLSHVGQGHFTEFI